MASEVIWQLSANWVQTKHGEAAFSYFAPDSWNKLTEDIRLAHL